MPPKARRLLLEQKLALGDAVVLSALVRDLAAACPGRYELWADVHCREVFENNPHCRVVPTKGMAGVPVARVPVTYTDGIKLSRQGVRTHMLLANYRDFCRRTGLNVEPVLPKGDIHLTDAEREPVLAEPYWLIVAGGKTDITVKWWPAERWQAVVDALAARGVRCVQAGATFRAHVHPKLDNVLSMVGRNGSARELFRLVYGARGVICPITAAMHVAACFDKPCVVIAAGREDPPWEQYTNEFGSFGPRCAPVAVEHRFLHTIGRLPCCEKAGCWKHRTLRANDGSRWDAPERICKLPVVPSQPGPAPRPRCMELIEPSQVVEAVMSYENGHPRNGFVEIPKGLFAQIKSAPPARPTGPPVPKGIDHPAVDGLLTAFVMCYGDHSALARRCVGSILETIPADRLDLRVICSACSPATLEFLRGEKRVAKVYDSPANPGKYVRMREAFADPDCPIVSKYLVWFDDDTAVLTPEMWSALCGTVSAHHAAGGRLYGNVYYHDLQQHRKGSADPLRWFREAPWWRGLPLHLRGGSGETWPNGTLIRFAAGWWWAMATEMIGRAGVPDARLRHNGGDITIGAQITQAGGKVIQVGPHGKSLVWTPPKEGGGRRGMTEPFPWSTA